MPATEQDVYDAALAAAAEALAGDAGPDGLPSPAAVAQARKILELASDEQAVAELAAAQGDDEAAAGDAEQIVEAEESPWQSYTGARGGKGWKNAQSGEIVYGGERPGSGNSGTGSGSGPAAAAGVSLAGGASRDSLIAARRALGALRPEQGEEVLASARLTGDDPGFRLVEPDEQPDDPDEVYRQIGRSARVLHDAGLHDLRAARQKVDAVMSAMHQLVAGEHMAELEELYGEFVAAHDGAVEELADRRVAAMEALDAWSDARFSGEAAEGFEEPGDGEWIDLGEAYWMFHDAIGARVPRVVQRGPARLRKTAALLLRQARQQMNEDAADA